MSYLKNVAKTWVIHPDGSINKKQFDTLWRMEIFRLYSDQITSAVLSGRKQTLRTALLEIALEKDIDLASQYVLPYLEQYEIALLTKSDNEVFEEEQLSTDISELCKKYPENWKNALQQAVPTSSQQHFLQAFEKQEPLNWSMYKTNARWQDVYIQLAKRCAEDPAYMRTKIVDEPVLMQWIVSAFLPRNSDNEKVLTARYGCTNAFARDLDQWLVPLIQNDDETSSRILEILKDALIKNGKIQKDRSIYPAMLYALQDCDLNIQKKIMNAIYPIVDIRKTYCGTFDRFWRNEHKFAWMSNDQKTAYIEFLCQSKDIIPDGLQDTYQEYIAKSMNRSKSKTLMLQHLFSPNNAREMLVDDKRIAQKLKMFQEPFKYENIHVYYDSNVHISSLMQLLLERDLKESQAMLEKCRFYQYLVLDKLLVLRLEKVNHIEKHIAFLSTASEWIRLRHNTTEHIVPVQRLLQRYINDKPLPESEVFKTIDMLAKYLLPGISVSLEQSIQSYNQLCEAELLDPNTISLNDHINTNIRMSQTNHDDYTLDSIPSTEWV